MSGTMRTAVARLLGTLLAGGLLLSTSLQAQWPSDPEVDRRLQAGVDHLYNLEFDSADSLFREVSRLRPSEPAGQFFEAMVDWWRILADYDNTSRDDAFIDKLDVVIEMCDRRLAKDPDDVTALFFKGGAVGFRGRLRANRGKWMGAANDGVIALPLVRKAYKLDPNNMDVLLGIGIYNYYAEVIPDRYPIVKPLMIFFPSGDRKKGLEQLTQAAANAKYARVEATYFLMQNEYLFEKDYGKALALARGLFAQYPKNPLFHRYLGRCLVAAGQTSEANEVFRSIERRFRERQTGYDRYDGRESAYYLGRNEFFAGQYEKALQYFYKSDEISRTLDTDGASGFMSMANLYIGMIYDLQGKRQLAQQQYRKVLAMKEYENTRRDAERYLKTPYGPTH